MGESLNRLKEVKLRYENIFIREIVRSDLDIIAKWPKYHKDLAWANFPAINRDLKNSWFKNNMKNHIAWFVILQSDDIIGRVSITLPMNGDDLIYGIVLRPDRINQGLGNLCTKLFIYMIHKIHQCNSIWLETQKNNQRACAVWKKIGFSSEGFHYRRNSIGRFEIFEGFRFYKDHVDSLDLDFDKIILD